MPGSGSDALLHLLEISPGLAPAEDKLLAFFARQVVARRQRNFPASLSEIERATGIGRKYVVSAAAGLRSKGLLEWTAGDRMRPNVYDLVALAPWYGADAGVVSTVETTAPAAAAEPARVFASKLAQVSESERTSEVVSLWETTLAGGVVAYKETTHQPQVSESERTSEVVSLWETTPSNVLSVSSSIDLRSDVLSKGKQPNEYTPPRKEKPKTPPAEPAYKRPTLRRPPGAPRYVFSEEAMEHAGWLLGAYEFDRWMPRTLEDELADKTTPDPRLQLLTVAKDYGLDSKGLATKLQKIQAALKIGRRRKGHWGYIAGAVAHECELARGTMLNEPVVSKPAPVTAPPPAIAPPDRRGPQQERRGLQSAGEILRRALGGNG